MGRGAESVGGEAVNIADVAARLKNAGFEHFHIDGEQGVAYVYFEGLLSKEAPCRTRERRRREFWEKYAWSGIGLHRKK